MAAVGSIGTVALAVDLVKKLANNFLAFLVGGGETSSTLVHSTEC